MEDTITLKRVKSLKDLPRMKGDIEPDYTLYENDGSGLTKIFLKAMYDTKRIYCDHFTDDTVSDKNMEEHDRRYTEYCDFSGAEDFFKTYKIYQEVK